MTTLWLLVVLAGLLLVVNMLAAARFEDTSPPPAPVEKRLPFVPAGLRVAFE